jgi:CheY-like chemotaxis protein
VARLKHIHELYRRVHAVNGNAGIAGLVQIAHMAAALEALLKELYENPKNINASTLRTVAAAVDFLGFLFERGTRPEKQEIPAANILVVDDEAISRRAIVYALEKAQLQSVSVEDPNAAFKLLSENQFDLVFLDVDMPGMTGYELCARLRSLPAHRKPPSFSSPPQRLRQPHQFHDGRRQRLHRQAVSLHRTHRQGPHPRPARQIAAGQMTGNHPATNSQLILRNANLMKKILIIEDDQIVANVYRNKLVVEGYLAEAASDGESGLKMMRTFQPDAIVLDLMLPKMSGVEVIKEIRGEAEFSKLPIIVLSNTYSTNLIQEAWKAGATKCVSKINCSPKIMLELMRNHRRRRGGFACPPEN